MHLGSRLDAASGLSRRRGAADEGCEWVADAAEREFALPEFPEQNGRLPWMIPAIPRLLPSWQRLRSILPEARRQALTALAPTAVLPTRDTQQQKAQNRQAHASGDAQDGGVAQDGGDAQNGASLAAAMAGGAAGALVGIVVSGAVWAARRGGSSLGALRWRRAQEGTAPVALG